MTGTPPPAAREGGLPYALGAYTLWGLLPLYFVLLNPVDPYALVGWRTLWTLPFCLLLLPLLGQWGAFRTALGNRVALRMMLISAALIAANWLIYIVAVQHGQFFATSIGYYLSPLLSVLIGTVFLKERLGALQWAAVSLATAGVALLAFGALDSLAISLGLALAFSAYGYVRKIAAVDALPGLTIEAMILVPVAIALIALAPVKETTFGQDWWISGLLVAAGPVTAVPLLLYAAAARRMTLSGLGFVQFMAPTLVFLMGLLVFGEEMDNAKLASFSIVWFAIGLFCLDIGMKSRRQRAAAKRSGSPVADSPS